MPTDPDIPLSPQLRHKVVLTVVSIADITKTSRQIVVILGLFLRNTAGFRRVE